MSKQQSSMKLDLANMTTSVLKPFVGPEVGLIWLNLIVKKRVITNKTKKYQKIRYLEKKVPVFDI